MSKFNQMKKIIIILLLTFTNYCLSQISQKSTEDYITKKMLIADPKFNKFVLDKNGTTLISWVNNGTYTEFRYNIREVAYTKVLLSNRVSSNSDDCDIGGYNAIRLDCIDDSNNCIQITIRDDTNTAGDYVRSIKDKNCTHIKNISGYANNVGIRNALTYLKILSINNEKRSEKRDPFLNLY